MKQDIVIYHGSQQIIKVPRFGVGKDIMTTGRAFTAQRTTSLQKSGLVLLQANRTRSKCTSCLRKP